MSDLYCPYCDHAQDINHDDGFGYAEDERHEVECEGCGKNYVFTTYMSFSYSEEKADCLNGKPHDMELVVHAPSDKWPDWKRCKDCDYEVRGEYEPKMSEQRTDLNTCPSCGGPADNGHSREDPPSVYYCSKCEAQNPAARNKQT